MAKKIDWTREMEEFLIDNYSRLTNQQLAHALNLKLTTTRTKLIALGLKRMELEYWTDEQTEYLVTHFTQKGDKELAEIFNSKWPKKKGWTLKHIEKKRKYLKLNRTPEELEAIKERHKKDGAYIRGSERAWKTRGVSPVGKLVNWGDYLYVKLEDRYEKLYRVIWEQANGAIPADMNVVRKNLLLPADDINNLELITDAELGARNSINRYPLEIRETNKLLNELTNKIKQLTDEKQN